MTTNNKNIHTAMVAAQTEFPTVGFDKQNPAFRSKYASLTGIVEAVRPILNRHGCYITHNSKLTERGVWVETRIVHGESGTEIVTETELPVDASTAQKVGGVLTYGRRYTLSMALGVVSDEDDDGNAISTPQTGATSQRTAPATKAPQSAPQPPPTGNGKAAPEGEDLYDENDPLFAEVKRLRTKAHTIGSSIWETKWDDVRHTNIGKMTTGRTQSIKMLNIEELRRLVQGLEDKQDSLRKPTPVAP